MSLDEFSAPSFTTVPERPAKRGHRDTRFLSEEQLLDEMIEKGEPERALQVEADLLDEVQATQYLPEGLARVTFKAIALAHSARQLYGIDTGTNNHTYQHIGQLIDASLEARHHIIDHHYETLSEEVAYLTGTISELAVYALIAYDASLEKPLTGRENGGRPRYIVPSTIAQDRGEFGGGPRYYSVKRHGVDFTATYVDGDDPHRYIQVKTRETQRKRYGFSVIVVPLQSLAFYPTDHPFKLARAIADDARGEGTFMTNNQIDTASIRVNALIQ